MKRKPEPTKLAGLHRQAERRGRKKTRASRNAETRNPRALARELEIHRPELERHKQSLRRVRQELRASRRELAEAERKYEELIRHAPARLYEFDFRTQRFTMVNDATCQMLGYTREEMLRMNPLDILDEEGQARFQTRVAQWLRGEKLDQNVEYRVITRGGRILDVVLNTTFTTDKSGKPLGATVVGHDVTERKRAEKALRESEQRLALALESGKMGTWEWNLLSNQAVWNAREYELLGLPPGDGRPPAKLFFQHVHPEDATGLDRSLKKAIEGSRDWMHEFRIVRADGGVRWLAGAGRVLVGANGQPERMVGVNYDITERREFEAELERLVAERTAKLQELVGELDHFSYAIMHDMRAPLRAMRGYGDLLMNLCTNPPAPEVHDYLRRICLAADRMDNLITDALDYSRVVRQQFLLEPVNLGKLLRGMLETYPKFQPENARVRLEGDIPVVVGHQAGLTQCFSNLLDNAVKFVEPGKTPEVRIWAEVRSQEPVPTDRDFASSRARSQKEAVQSPEPKAQGLDAATRYATHSPQHESFHESANPPIHPSNQFVRIWVQDNGVGIAESMLPRIFDIFSQGQSRLPGTGIGLALARKLVDRMGGKVGVQSEEGKGSRFWVELKRAAAA